MQSKFNIVFERIKAQDVCKNFSRKILILKEKFDEKIAWELLFDNIEWLINKGILTTTELVEWFSEEDLNAHYIFSKGFHEVKNRKAIGIKTAELEVSGHSRIVLFDNAKCSAFDTSFVTGFNDSNVTIEGGIASVFHNSKCYAKYARIDAWDNTQVFSKECYVEINDEAIRM